MDFAAANTAVKEWLSKPERSFQLSSVVEEEKKMVFACTGMRSGLFYIIMQQDGDRNKWHVWSDDDTVLHSLNPVIEYLGENDCKPLEDMLQHVQDSLAKSVARDQQNKDAAAEEDEEEDEDEEDYGDDLDYYMNDDVDAEGDKEEESSDDEAIAAFSNSAGNMPAVKRLTSDLKKLQKAGDLGFTAHPIEDELFHWSVKLTDFPKESLLAKDLADYARKFNTEPVIEMDMKFPRDYPYSPPFLRVIKPRFKFLTGHVTVGGSICMEMLTPSGWRPTNDIESLLVTVRAEILGDPDARLDQTKANAPYSESEAKDAFDRMVKRYNWK